MSLSGRLACRWKASLRLVVGLVVGLLVSRSSTPENILLLPSEKWRELTIRLSEKWQLRALADVPDLSFHFI